MQRQQRFERAVAGQVAKARDEITVLVEVGRKMRSGGMSEKRDADALLLGGHRGGRQRLRKYATVH